MDSCAEVLILVKQIKFAVGLITIAIGIGMIINILISDRDK